MVGPGGRRSATGASPLLWRPLTTTRLGADLYHCVCWYIASKSGDVTKKTQPSFTDDVGDVEQAGTTQNFIVGHPLTLSSKYPRICRLWFVNVYKLWHHNYVIGQCASSISHWSTEPVTYIKLRPQLFQLTTTVISVLWTLSQLILQWCNTRLWTRQAPFQLLVTHHRPHK